MHDIGWSMINHEPPNIQSPDENVKMYKYAKLD